VKLLRVLQHVRGASLDVATDVGFFCGVEAIGELGSALGHCYHPLVYGFLVASLPPHIYMAIRNIPA
jgi:Ni,Fe-hydrogenase I cytochrome b subunit